MTQCGVHGSMEYVKQLEAERDALRARIDDVEGMAKFLQTVALRTSSEEEIARAVSAWLKEGK